MYILANVKDNVGFIYENGQENFLKKDYSLEIIRLLNSSDTYDNPVKMFKIFEVKEVAPHLIDPEHKYIAIYNKGELLIGHDIQELVLDHYDIDLYDSLSVRYFSIQFQWKINIMEVKFGMHT